MELCASYDAAVIGGGASGLAAAICAARNGKRVVIIERDVACGLKVLATGNGRCNLSNIDLDPQRYRHPAFVADVMGDTPEVDLDDLFSSLGIFTTREEDRIYPHSMRAESVRDALIDRAAQLGIEILCGANVVDAHLARGIWSLMVRHPTRQLIKDVHRGPKNELRAQRRALASIKTVDTPIEAADVIIACGGAPSQLASLFHLPVIEPKGVLCPIKTTIPSAPNALAALDGLRARVNVTLRRGEKSLWSEQGEILFRSYGVSGVVIFNLSRRIKQGDMILIDFFPELDKNQLLALFRQREALIGPFATDSPSWFDGLIAPALGNVVCDICEHCHPGDPDVTHLVSITKKFKLSDPSLASDQSAQVARGGIPTDCVHAGTLACIDSTLPHLHVCGEALDVDADCGGFNLAWAWLSGMRAAQSL